MFILSVGRLDLPSSVLKSSFFFFMQKTAYDLGLGIPAVPLFRSKSWSLFYGSFLLPFKIISVTFRRVIRTDHKKASKIWRHERSEERRVGKECRCRSSPCA